LIGELPLAAHQSGGFCKNDTLRSARRRRRPIFSAGQVRRALEGPKPTRENRDEFYEVNMAAAQIDFWFTMGSTYSFLSVMRLEEVERSTGVSFRWRPFHLLIILQEMKHVPFADKPTKSAYMWRDIERRTAMYGLQARLPAPYPAKQSVVANLIATVGMREGWGPDFVQPLISGGSSSGKRLAANQTYRKVYATLAKTPTEYSNSRPPMK
jgi:2-hydroxychromene-2-carboxylate isomerase